MRKPFRRTAAIAALVLALSGMTVVAPMQKVIKVPKKPLLRTKLPIRPRKQLLRRNKTGRRR